MAEFLKSAFVTNATATPLVFTNSMVSYGMMNESCGKVLPTAAGTVGSTYRFCRVPSNARVSAVYAKHLAFGDGAVDVGLYQIDGGVVVDADLFASAIALTTARANTDITYESLEYSTAESEKMLWEVLGLTVDPGVMYDVTATVTTAIVVAPVDLFIKVAFAY